MADKCCGWESGVRFYQHMCDVSCGCGTGATHTHTHTIVSTNSSNYYFKVLWYFFNRFSLWHPESQVKCDLWLKEVNRTHFFFLLPVISHICSGELQRSKETRLSSIQDGRQHKTSYNSVSLKRTRCVHPFREWCNFFLVFLNKKEETNVVNVLWRVHRFDICVFVWLFARRLSFLSSTSSVSLNPSVTS